MNQPVLVLNANYEPLNICSTRRAVGLMMDGKAILLANGREPIRTAVSSYPRPSVVLLAYMVARPRRRVKLCKIEVFRRDQYTCLYCGRHAKTLTVDHIVPKHQGGTHSWENLASACPACNRKKGGRTPEEANMPLLRQPGEPTASTEYLFGAMLETHSDWEVYLKGW
nr:HNH endonuclease [Anaerolineae bacterium]